MKDYIKENKYKIIIGIILILGILVRIVGISEYPAGLNQDEASAGYEAYSILTSGVDRNNKSFPVHFISWGSGQNVLYSYLMIPFIWILGLNVVSVRLPMAIIGCISLVIIYKMLKRTNKKIAIIGLAFFAICPWHIMKSRWGLESNIFPDMVLISVYLMLKALDTKKMYWFYIGIGILSLSVYSYGTSYAFLPIFIIILLIYLLRTKKIKFKNVFISMIISAIIALLMMLFVIINKFDLNEIKLGLVTIPRVYENRFETVVTIFSPDFFKTILDNFIYNSKIILYQIDGYNYNSIQFFGIVYVFSLPFTIIGIYNSIRNRNLEKNILNIWFFVSFILLFILEEANINRLNIIMIPLVIYTIIGIYDVLNSYKYMLIPIVSIYSILFILFICSYINTQGKKGSTFTQGVKEPIQYASLLDVDTVYISKSFTEPYIYTLFYTKTPVNEYINTVKYIKQNVAFEKIESFGKYKFYVPNQMNEKNAVYIVPNNFNYDKDKFKAITWERYMLLKEKEED